MIELTTWSLRKAIAREDFRFFRLQKTGDFDLFEMLDHREMILQEVTTGQKKAKVVSLLETRANVGTLKFPPSPLSKRKRIWTKAAE